LELISSVVNMSDHWNVLKECDESFELFIQELPAGLDLIADTSQLSSVICFNDQRKGSINLKKLKCNGLKNLQCLTFLLSLQPQHLRSVSCIDCDITDTDVKQLVEELHSRGGSLTHLDLSHNRIGSAGTRELSNYIHEHGLKHLNLSKNRLCDVWNSRGSTLGNFDTAGICFLLEGITSSSDSLLTDDHPKLETLNISRNMLGQDPALISTLCRLIEANVEHLTVLNLTGNYFDAGDMRRLGRSMQRNTHITSYHKPSPSPSPSDGGNVLINLSSSNLAPLDFLFLKNRLESGTPCSVDFSWNREFGVCDDSFPVIQFPFLNVHTLRLTNISMDVEYADSLRQVLQHPQCRIQSLDVAGNASTLEKDGFNHLLAGMKANTSLRYLSLVSCIPRNYRGYEQIKEAMEINNTLVELDLSQSCGCRFRAAPIIEALTVNTTLQTLRMSRCEINAASIMGLSAVVETNKTLTCLDLSHNHLCKFGWDRDYDVAPALSLTVSLRHLNTDLGEPLPPLAEWAPISSFPPPVLPLSSPLRELDLSHNKLDDSVVMGLSQALKNKHLNVDTLDISFCGVGEEAGRLFGPELSHVTSLKTLRMSNNFLGVIGIEVTFFYIKTNI
jgi:hypothetical protein